MNAIRGAMLVVCLVGCEGQGNAALQPPPATTVTNEESFRVAIGNDGHLHLDGARVDVNALAATAKERGIARARVRITPAVSLRRLGEVVEALRGAGVDVSFEVRLRLD